MAYTDTVNRGNQFVLASDGVTVGVVGVRDLVQPTVLAVGSPGSGAPLANRATAPTKVKNLNDNNGAS